ncbi:MAG: MFS transporter [Dehalococcoidia bacterium]
MATLTNEAPAAPPRRGLSLQTFSAFKSAPFTFLWLNSFSFALSQSIRQFTFTWLVISELGNSGRTIGLLSFALGIPVLVFGLPAGALTDRMNRRFLLFASQGSALVITAVTALVVRSGDAPVSAYVGLAMLLGVTVAFGQPVRSSIVPSLVPKERLLNAITLQGLGQNVSSIAGPFVLGDIIANWGVTGAFWAQAGLLALGLLALIPLRVPNMALTTKRDIVGELREGFTFIRHHEGVRTLLIALLMTALVMAGTFQALLPKLAFDEWGASGRKAAWLFGLMGFGMLSTSLFLASRGRLEKAGLAFACTLIVGGTLNTLTGLSPTYTIAAILLFVTGFNAGFFQNLNLMLIQAHTPAPIMGRVMAIYTMCMAGGMPIGALLAGEMSDVVGADTWYVVCGITFGISALLLFLTQPALRRMRSMPEAEVRPVTPVAEAAAGG